ncbi:MAG: hypothetical protein LUH42_06875 [Oscillospiraceae bacterium]|nr:hypothetical protein [Oscillospiraceae bacterium]
MNADIILSGIRNVGPFVLATAVFGIAWYVSSPKFQGRRIASFFAIRTNVGIFFVVIGTVLGLVYIGAKEVERMDENSMVITAENTTVPLFLTLTPETTIGEVEAMAEEYGWFTSMVQQSSSLELSVYPDREYAGNKLYGGKKGVELELYFESDGIHSLLSAYLLIITDSGTATCRYFPTDYTEWGGETGFNLTVKAKGHLFSKKYLLDTPQEVIDIVYPIVYPDGLS